MYIQLEGALDSSHNKTKVLNMLGRQYQKNTSLFHFTPPSAILNTSHNANFLENLPNAETEIIMFSKLSLLYLYIPAEFIQEFISCKR